MRKMLLGTLILAIATGFIVTHAATLGLDRAWPFALGLALAPLGARGRGLMRTSVSVVTGVALGFGAFVVVSKWMPFIPISFGIMVGIAVAIMGTLSAVTPKTFNLPAMLIAFAAFYGSYETAWAQNRAAFYGEATAAAASVVVALLGGLLVSFAASRLLAIEARQRAGEVIPFRARLRVADAGGERAAAGGGI